MAFTGLDTTLIPLTIPHYDQLYRRRPLMRPINVVAANKPDTTNPNPLARARKPSDIRTISYPDGISGICFDLNEDAKHGLIRYDRDFLLQFMPVCKDRPEMLPPLDAIGLVPNGDIPMIRGHSGLHRKGAPVPSHQGSVALGALSGTAGSPNPVGANQSYIAIPAIPAGNTGTHHDPPTVDIESSSPEVVSRNVKALLNSLTMETFDDTSGRIIQWVNMSKGEKDDCTLKHVIHLVVEEATNNTIKSEMCASLCKMMVKKISRRVQDVNISNGQGGQGGGMNGGQIFRKHLHERCLSDIDRGWATNRTATAAVSTVPQSTEDGRDDSVKDANHPTDTNKDNAARKAKRQCLGTIQFISELFKQRVLKKLIIHQCLKKFLGPVNPDEEDIESLCVLLPAVGKRLDIVSRKARAKLDGYTSRMKEWIQNPNVAQRMRDMLNEVLRLRERKWVSHPVQVPAQARSDEIHKIGANSEDHVVVAEVNGSSAPSKAGDLFTLGNTIQSGSLIFVDKMEAVATHRQRREDIGHNQDGSDAASGMVMTRSPPGLMGDVSGLHSRHRSIEEQTLVAFLERLVQMKMCSTALIPAAEKHDAIISIVDDIAEHAPDALRKLSLIVKGGGLE
ncbi:hypothetical protein D9619_009623 [Psilocybe cf. subviscida]|uniref:MIF4G domain-containing protein n=1 Tax=Psilocybe cf. subviscida TaxID=2480587 RepID=A0A8H5F5Z9_9AGAR|nr:hypothetical protein D9619_009623 [Psilocybe cf. subviscida]